MLPIHQTQCTVFTSITPSGFVTVDENSDCVATYAGYSLCNGVHVKYDMLGPRSAGRRQACSFPPCGI